MHSLPWMSCPYPEETGGLHKPRWDIPGVSGRGNFPRPPVAD